MLKDYGYEDEHERYCNKLLHAPAYDDHLTDDDSDGEGAINLKVDELLFELFWLIL